MGKVWCNTPIQYRAAEYVLGHAPKILTGQYDYFVPTKQVIP